MAQPTLQPSAAIVVPFGTGRSNAIDTSQWKAWSAREAAAIDAWLPVLPRRFSRYTHNRKIPPVTAVAGDSLDGSEA